MFTSRYNDFIRVKFVSDFLLWFFSLLFQKSMRTYTLQIPPFHPPLSLIFGNILFLDSGGPEPPPLPSTVSCICSIFFFFKFFEIIRSKYKIKSIICIQLTSSLPVTKLVNYDIALLLPYSYMRFSQY